MRGLISALSAEPRPERWSMIIQVSIDESGYGAKGKHEAFLFAGYAGPVSNWEEFKQKWNAILNESPKLSLDEVKKLMRWAGPKSDERAVRLANTTKECGLKSVRLKIPYPDYESVIIRSGLPYLDNPYFFGWMALLFSLIGEIRNTPSAKVELYYDENLPEQDKVRKGYEDFVSWAKSRHPTVLKMIRGDPIPKNDSDFLPLQAADALAWNTHRDHIQKAKGKRHHNPLWTTLDSGPVFVNATWDVDDLRDVIGSQR